MEFARSVGEQLKSNREKTIRETVDFDASLAKTDAEKLAALSKKPVAMWTEQEAKSMEEMRRKERQATDYRVQAEMAQKKDAVVNPEQEPLSALHIRYGRKGRRRCILLYPFRRSGPCRRSCRKSELPG